MSRRLLAALSAASLAAFAFTPSLADGATTSFSLSEDSVASVVPGPAEGEQQDGVLTSFDGVKIHYTIFRPAGASAANPVPMVFSSHGWGGSRTKNMKEWTDRGFGGISFDQRGFGQSGDRAYVQEPTREAKDVQGLLDIVQGLDWVMRDVDATADGVWGLDDPTVFAVGGSYGGGYQTVTALTETADHGDTRFDALAPEITWYDLPQALGPQKVARTAWLTLLQGTATQDTAQYIQQAYAYGAATGQWPDGTIGGTPAPSIPDIDTTFNANGPSGFVEGGTYVPDGGVRLDIPALWRQGSSDTLFNLNEGLDNLDAMTDEARAGSYLIGYNGGHVLPTAFPMGTATGSDSCSAATPHKSFGEMTAAFFRIVAAGGSTDGFLDHRYGITDMNGACVWTDDVRSTMAFPVGYDVELTTGAATTAGAGAPQYLPVFTAVKTTVLTGVPTLDATYYSPSADQRVFFGLAKGTSPANATVMQHQMQPHLELLPSIGHDITVELGAGGMTLKQGETLYLVVAPFVEMYFGTGSTRTPGVVALEDMTINVPLQPGYCVNSSSSTPLSASGTAICQSTVNP